MRIEKFENLSGNLLDYTEYAIHIKNFKQALNYGLVLNKLHRTIKSKKNAWLKLYIDGNTDLRKKRFF